VKVVRLAASAIARENRIDRDIAVWMGG